jgi:hypothetical protein
MGEFEVIIDCRPSFAKKNYRVPAKNVEVILIMLRGIRGPVYRGNRENGKAERQPDEMNSPNLYTEYSVEGPHQPPGPLLQISNA